jgi:ribosome-associated translation inhibitor RaiA
MKKEKQEAREVYKKVLLQGVKQIISLENMENDTTIIANIYEKEIQVYSDAEMFNNAVNIVLKLMNKQLNREKKKILNIIECSISDEDIQEILVKDMPILLEIKEYLKNNEKIELQNLMEDLLEKFDDFDIEEIDEKLLFDTLNNILSKILINQNEEKEEDEGE